MKTIPPVCENGEKGLRASCTRLPTIGSGHWIEEVQRAEGGVASLSQFASFREGGSWHLGTFWLGSARVCRRKVEWSEISENLQQYEAILGKGLGLEVAFWRGLWAPTGELRCRRAPDSDWRRIQVPQSSSNGQCSPQPGFSAWIWKHISRNS